ncbi:MAG: MBL fold metallo-hydrolase [Lachnospiraceae bacterium]|nr:MBL fold metallo-hydrolase [Lachnospiraceae bacterium]
MEKKLYITKLQDDLYLMDEAHEATGYILVGDEKVCVIDTMNGHNDLLKAVREITDKPITVINTHGHPDHILGNVYFDSAFIHPDDLGLAESFIDTPEFRRVFKDNGLTMPPFEFIRGGDKIDLGGKTLEVYELPGHTAGGILLLWREGRILFTGDSINHHLWMQLDRCLEIDEYIRALDKVMFLEKEADRLLHGHAQGFDDISLMRCLRRGLVEISEGHTENDLPYEWFGGISSQHSFSLEEGRNYQQTDSVICYEKGNIKKSLKASDMII